ncbi:unnamed protein product [Prorocentrum cordatum]|uniref:Uncharacterized protein n=1 Tax=Prorocentrum cordatum TaxID=2364126 RepID=A0ABN9TI81_9DINO|nr:unnamed protein product [Polarella glacialis]
MPLISVSIWLKPQGEHPWRLRALRTAPGDPRGARCRARHLRAPCARRARQRRPSGAAHRQNGGTPAPKKKRAHQSVEHRLALRKTPRKEKAETRVDPSCETATDRAGTPRGLARPAIEKRTAEDEEEAEEEEEEEEEGEGASNERPCELQQGM